MSKDLTFDNLLKEQLQDKQVAAMYLEECLADGNIEIFRKALKDAANAQLAGITALSRDVDLNRQSLYRTLSEDDNPQLNTLIKALDDLGLQIAISIQSSSNAVV